MRTMLTLKRLFLGLNGIAINGQGLDIHITPEFNKYGVIQNTRWDLSGVDFSKVVDDDGNVDDEICIKDFLAGIRIDDEANNVAMKFFDATGKHARYLTDRIPSNSFSTVIKKRSMAKSAFSRLLDIIRIYYSYIDDDVIDVLQNERIMKIKCKICYPLLVLIPDEIQSDEDLLKHFSSLARNGETKVRYWKKILVLNGKRYWLSNHIFHKSIQPFKELMIDLTGVEINIENDEENKINDDLNKEENDIKMERIKEAFLQIYDDSETVEDLLTGMKDLLGMNINDANIMEDNVDTDTKDIDTEDNIEEEDNINTGTKYIEEKDTNNNIENMLGNMLMGFGKKM